MTAAIIKRFKKNKGYLRHTGSLPRSEKYELKLMLLKGQVIKVKRGLYRHTELISAHQEQDVSHIVPEGIFCMYSAWAHYELTTHISSEYHIAVPKSLKISVPDYPPIKLYYWNEPTFELGLTNVRINDIRIKMYDLERSVCDAVKFRNKIGNEMLGEILKNYVRKKDKNLDKLMKYSAKLRISITMDQLLQVII